MQRMYQLSVIIILFMMWPTVVGAQTTSAPQLPEDVFFRARVLVAEDRSEVTGDVRQDYQDVRVRALSGPSAGTEYAFRHEGYFSLREDQRLRRGQEVIVMGSQAQSGELVYSIVDKFRLRDMAVVVLIFFGLAVLFGRMKGLRAIVGLLASGVVLVSWILPRIVSGADPFTTTLIGAGMISVVSLYLAHGFTRRTTVALIGMLITIVLAIGAALAVVTLAHLSGFGTEEAVYLKFGDLAALNMRGLLLAGMIIGTLGVLDDIATAQAAVVDELHQANRQLSARELYQRGLSVGREHIASLVNTLVLAYAGASLPLFLAFTVYRGVPWWVTLNSEFVAEEILRALVGSAALVLAVPITTALAARFIPVRNTKNPD